MQIVICDDDIRITSYIEKLLFEIGDKHSIAVDISVFFSGEELISYIEKQNFYFDLIYLDIEMKDMNGIETARKIRKLYQSRPILIYISAYDRYCKQLFEVEPFRFLDKPIEKDQFETCFLAAIEKIRVSCHKLSFYSRSTVYQVPLADIIYLESRKRHIFVYTKEKTYQNYGKLNDIEQQIKNSVYPFIRIHQSFLVNYEFIHKITYQAVELRNHTILPISESKRDLVRQEWMRKMKQK